MKLRVLWAGRTKNPNLAALLNDYASRIKHLLPLEVLELKEAKGEGNRRIEAEGEALLAALNPSDRVVALDPNGRAWTSEQTASFLEKHMAEDSRHLTFVVGGFGGLSPALKRRADVQWSLSPLTFSHDLARVVLLEQIYRAISIVRHLPYSK